MGMVRGEMEEWSETEGREGARERRSEIEFDWEQNGKKEKS